MRTLDEITANISLISQTMNGIESQISLLDDEYQKAAIENIGEPYEEWTEMRGKLQSAWDCLNQLWHMEVDIELELKCSKNESDEIYAPDSEFRFRCDAGTE